MTPPDRIRQHNGPNSPYDRKLAEAMKNDMILSESTVNQIIRGGAGNRARDIVAMLSGQASIEPIGPDRYQLIIRDKNGHITDIVEGGLVMLINDWLLCNTGYRVYTDRRRQKG